MFSVEVHAHIYHTYWSIGCDAAGKPVWSDRELPMELPGTPRLRGENPTWDFENSTWDFENSTWDFENPTWDFENPTWDF